MLRLPFAGNIMAYFQYVLGLSLLGHDVVYVEESGWPYSSYDPVDGHWHDFPTRSLPFVRALVDRHCPEVGVVYLDQETGLVDGSTREDLEGFLGGCDLLLDVGGVCWLPEFELCTRRALVDMDPVFSQLDGFASKVLESYHCRFSYGTRLGIPDCSAPTGGVDWMPTLPPVVGDLWPVRPSGPDSRFTTVANWSAYGGLRHENHHYGQKDEEFVKLLELPSRTDQPLELALAGASDEVRSRFRDAGWSVIDGAEVSLDIETYVNYVAGSRGELSLVNHASATTESGWFSDR